MSCATTSQDLAPIPPILLLPDEILSDIFLLCCRTCLHLHADADAWPLHARPSWHTHNHSCTSRCWDWLTCSAMLVCRRWRDVLIGTKTLWACPSFDHEHMSDIKRHEMFSVCGDAPLIIRHILTGTDTSMWLADFLGPQGGVSRCRELMIEICKSPKANMQDLFNVWPESAPFLEVLSLSTDCFGHTRSPCLPLTLLRSAPRLRTLFLDNCALDHETWRAFPLHSLTTLAICDICKDGLSPTTADVLALLQQTSQLQTLVLWCLDGDAEVNPLQYPDIIASIPEISRISLCGSGLQPLEIMQRIIIPVYAVLELKFYYIRSEDNVPSRLADVLRAHWKVSTLLQDPIAIVDAPDNFDAPPSLRSASVTCSEDRISIMGYVHPTISPQRDSTGPHDPLVHIELNDTRFNPVPSIPSLLRALRAYTITSLHLTELSLIGALEWQELWFIIPAVRVLHVTKLSPAVVSPFILTLTPHPTIAQQCLLHALQELRLHEASFSGVGDTPPFAQLRACLKARSDRGSPLRVLELKQCTVITEDDVRALSGDGSVGRIASDWDLDELLPVEDADDTEST
ncbi:hypothetical protein CONPUDRAFT_167594 [Coniophora puteana RWD-64-598 SS2]|uniref:Uncharacterized protein n=1 Tax=Coniophora puteana (strain RWD-64-598) TaxID=741705 RepID=A0A5M3MJ28_CONPW|nr:uncharacterized protein CONPUDRAFT_167594 [Coniophora puteana RWD-64-598 SS2]EIW78621.1 hypothetical protein CONPUDRAFT_167594 [Coniophora puteana RWD-64-598 SS2]